MVEAGVIKSHIQDIYASMVDIAETLDAEM